jgi:hypothetical protein
MPTRVKRGLIVCAVLSISLGYITGSREAIGHPENRGVSIFAVTVSAALLIFGIYGAYLAVAWCVRSLWRKMRKAE